MVRVDEKAYKEQLKYDADGAKLNPISLNGIASADAAVIGKRLIELYQKYAPKSYSEPELLIGDLYGFELYVRRKLTTVDTAFSSKIDFVTTLYAQSKSTGIKYLQNGGAPNIDNPKIAARYFLNAIDRVISLAEKYERDLVELDEKIPEIRKLTEKVFDKESELNTLKLELHRLEVLISQKIHDKDNCSEGEGLFPETDQAEGQELIVPSVRR
jgi:hypothetical protein